jgi:hypothetical protein
MPNLIIFIIVKVCGTGAQDDQPDGQNGLQEKSPAEAGLQVDQGTQIQVLHA